MKRMVLGASMGLVALVFLVSPAMAANPQQGLPALSAADQAFLATLATPAPTLAARHPSTSREGKAFCTASANCGSGGTISCNGNSTCSNADRDCASDEQGHVTCDGVTTLCSQTCEDCSVYDLPCARFLCSCRNKCSACGGVKTVFCFTTCTCNSPGC